MNFGRGTKIVAPNIWRLGGWREYIGWGRIDIHGNGFVIIGSNCDVAAPDVTL